MKGQWIVASCWLLTAACEKSAQDQQTKAEQAQREANERSDKAQREANEKSDKAQREANQKAEKAQKEADDKSVRANAEAQRETAKAQAKANETIRNVHEDLLKDRNDFQVEAHKSLDDLDGEIDRLKVKAEKAGAKAKSDFDAAIRDAEAKRATVAQDLTRLEQQSAQSFDTFKVRLNKEIEDLKKSVDSAAGKL